MSRFWETVGRSKKEVGPGSPAGMERAIRLARVFWRRLRHWRPRPARQLRLCESLPLGERRFVAVIEFEQSRFLVGGTAASLCLLATLNPGMPAAVPSGWPGVVADDTWIGPPRAGGKPAC